MYKAKEKYRGVYNAYLYINFKRIYWHCHCHIITESKAKSNGKKASPESERYRKCLFGYSRVARRYICTFTLAFSHGHKSHAGQGTP